MSGVDKDETRRIFQYERYLQTLNLKNGVIVEAGVGSGGGLNYFLKLQRNFGDKRIIFAFDSFQGFPKGHFNDSEEFRKFGKPGYREYTIDFIKNSLKSCGVSDQELSRVKFRKGFIPGSFEMFPSERVALLNCDLDLYESTKDTLNFFWNRMLVGGIVMLDEYDIDQDQIKWPGAKIAVDEFCREHGIEVHRGFGNRAFLKRT